MKRLHVSFLLAAVAVVATSSLFAGATCPSCVVRTQNRAPQQSEYFEDTPYYKQSIQNVNIQDRDRDQFASPDAKQNEQSFNQKRGPNPNFYQSNRSGAVKNRNSAYEDTSSSSTSSSSNDSKLVKDPKYNPFSNDSEKDKENLERVNNNNAQGPRTVPFQNNMR